LDHAAGKARVPVDGDGVDVEELGVGEHRLSQTTHFVLVVAARRSGSMSVTPHGAGAGV